METCFANAGALRGADRSALDLGSAPRSGSILDRSDTDTGLSKWFGSGSTILFSREVEEKVRRGEGEKKEEEKERKKRREKERGKLSDEM